MNKRKIALVMVSALLLGMYLDFKDTGALQDDNCITRQETGEGEEELRLLLNAEDVLEDYSYTLTVEEELPDKETVEKYLQQAKEEIDEGFCDEGEHLSHVTGGVHIADNYVNGLVQAEWLFDNYDVMETDGTSIDEAVPQEGIVVETEARLSCYETQESYHFSFMLFPKEKTKSEQLLADIQADIGSQLAKVGEKSLILPLEMDGIHLTWSQQRTHYSLKILVLEFVVMVGLLLARKEEQKKERKRRQEQMQLDYPEIVSKILILCGAGMSVKQAWNKISASYLDRRKKDKRQKRYAYEEMLRTNREMLDGVSERIAIQKFGEHAGLSSYHRFSRLLVENMQKGAKGMDVQLCREADDAFEERKNIARKLGEEAGTKMLFPMMIMLSVVMAVIMVPAIMSFQ